MTTAAFDHRRSVGFVHSFGWRVETLVRMRIPKSELSELIR